MSSTPAEYSKWFHDVTGDTPHDWQAELGTDATCSDRLIRIPTGFGKTAGTALAWLYHRVARNDTRWPARLVFTLPMRVLVEQTQANLHRFIENAGLADKVAVHVLMGGVRTERWFLDPDKPAILLGTQDMLLSRALSRGYGAARGQWPMDFALLHHDALWVLDEVQLMDTGLMTSAQLAAFRHQDASTRLRPAATWWMSATLQPAWLRGPDTNELVTRLCDRILTIPADKRDGDLWNITKAAERRADVDDAPAIASLARAEHQPGTLTLVIVNRVDTAVKTYQALERAGRKDAEAPDLRLVHSRFRGVERRNWSATFLARNSKEMPPHGRIIVSTQVIEAGVDISARLLITQLAPWSSLVQRAGRAARYPGETARIIVVGSVPERDRDAAPYELAALAAADEGFGRLLAHRADASLAALTALEERLHGEDPELLARLYPYAPAHVLQRRELDDLFDTSPDLGGADLDVSPFIRSGEERDVTIVWRAIDTAARSIPRATIGPVARDELCPVPLDEARAWLKDRRGYVLDYVEGVWKRVVDPRRLVPGAMMLVAADDGGYDPVRGWDASSRSPVEPAPPAPEPESPDSRFGAMAAAEDDDSTSIAQFKTIATHGRETANEVAALCDALGVPEPFRGELLLAARWHDAGKVHDVFQDAIKDEARAQAAPLGQRRDLAKAPENAWRRPRPYPSRPGFRHELASTLALFELLRRTAPEHPALIGPYREILAAAGIPIAEVSEPIAPEHPLAREIAALGADSFDRVAYLVCSHHGKVRCTWASTPADQENARGSDMAIHGVAEGDELPRLALCDDGGAVHEVPALRLSLEAAALGLGGRYGRSWTERVAGLRERTGPFTLAFLEAILRAADVRASRLESPEESLP